MRVDDVRNASVRHVNDVDHAVVNLRATQNTTYSPPRRECPLPFSLRERVTASQPANSNRAVVQL